MTGNSLLRWYICDMQLFLAITASILFCCVLPLVPLEGALSSDMLVPGVLAPGFGGLVLKTGRKSTLQLLRNRTRNIIMNCISAYPGIGPGELGQKTGISSSTLRYHLERLEQTGLIVRRRPAGNMAFFPSGRCSSDLEARVMSNMRNRTRGRLILLLKEKEDCSRHDLAAMIGISLPAVSWHTKRLVDDGIVEVNRECKELRYHLTMGTLEVLENLESG